MVKDPLPLSLIKVAMAIVYCLLWPQIVTYIHSECVYLIKYTSKMYLELIIDVSCCLASFIRSGGIEITYKLGLSVCNII